MTTKIAWAKILGLLGLTGSAGVGTGYGATQHTLGKVIDQLEEEYRNLEQSMTETTEKIDNLNKNLITKEAITKQQDSELTSLKARLRDYIDREAKLETQDKEKSGTLADLRAKLAANEQDIDYFVRQVTEWVKQNRQRQPNCSWADSYHTYLRTRSHTFRIGDKSATLEFLALECPTSS